MIIWLQKDFSCTFTSSPGPHGAQITGLYFVDTSVTVRFLGLNPTCECTFCCLAFKFVKSFASLLTTLSQQEFCVGGCQTLWELLTGGRWGCVSHENACGAMPNLSQQSPTKKKKSLLFSVGRLSSPTPTNEMCCVLALQRHQDRHMAGKHKESSRFPET